MSNRLSLSEQKQITIRFKSSLKDLKRRFPQVFQQHSANPIILVSIAEQKLHLFYNSEVIASYLISSAEKGIGNISGSLKTPLGLHQISDKYGEHASSASIFKARENTHSIAKILNDPDARSPDDNITSRILCLEGLEDRVNKGLDKDGKCVDSHSRYIYIHGTDEEGRLGTPASHGCVRMAKKDVIELFEKVEEGYLVIITED